MTHDQTPGLPLARTRVMVTRAENAAPALSAMFRALGAEVIEAPVTRIVPLDPGPARAAIAGLAGYQWLIFTSRNAVESFGRILQEEGRDVRALAGARIAAVGPATAEALAALGITVDVVPTRFVAEGLLEALFGRVDIGGRHILYLAARRARDVLPRGLRAMGATVDVVHLYESVADVAGASALRERLLSGGVDVVTLTAGSSVRALVDAVGAGAASQAQLVSIGPATSAAIRAAGLTVHAEAKESTLDGLVRAVVAGRR